MYLVNTTFQAELSIAEKFLEELDSFIPTVERATALHSPVPVSYTHLTLPTKLEV